MALRRAIVLGLMVISCGAFAAAPAKIEAATKLDDIKLITPDTLATVLGATDLADLSHDQLAEVKALIETAGKSLDQPKIEALQAVLTTKVA